MGLLVVQDTMNDVHIVDLLATHERTQDNDSVVVSLCTRDVIASLGDAVEHAPEHFEDIRAGCRSCERALSRLDIEDGALTEETPNA